MQNFATAQTNFASGVLDPKLHGRIDIKHYKNGAETLNNTEVDSEGGVRVRGGLEHRLKAAYDIYIITGITPTAPNGGTAANALDDDTSTLLTTTGGASTTNPFVIVHYDLGSSKQVMFADMLGLKLESGSVPSANEVQAQYSVNNTDWTIMGSAVPSVTGVAINRRVRGPVTGRYFRVVRIGATDLTTDNFTLNGFNLWQYTEDLSDVLLFSFDFGDGQHYLCSMTAYNLSVIYEGNLVADIPVFPASDEIKFVDYTQSADTLILVNKNHRPEKILRGSANHIWDVWDLEYAFVPKFAFVPVESNPAATLTPSAISGTVNLTAGSSVFLASDVGGYITGNGGEVRITEYKSGTLVIGKVVLPFIDSSAIASGDWTIERGYEDVWSEARGWPNSAFFFKGRFGHAGSKSRPNTAWLTRSGEYFNFDPGAELANEGIDKTADTDQVNTFRYAIATGSDLAIFSEGAEFTLEGKPLTPETAEIVRHDKRGCANIKPVYVDGSAFFIQKDANVLREFRYSGEIEGKYTADSVSLLSTFVINSPKGMAHLPPYGARTGDYIFIANEDGTWATMNTLRTQEITAFCTGSTDGEVLSFGNDGKYMYAAVKRTVEDVPGVYIERINDEFRLDAAVKLTSETLETVWAIPEHLEGKSVRVIADGYLEANPFTVTDGSITISRPSYQIQVGLSYLPTVTLLPSELALPDGPSTGRKRRVVSVSIKLKDSLGVVVNGVALKFRRFGQDIFGAPLPPFTGVKKVTMKGWGVERRITITQDEPQPFELLSATQRIRV